MVTAVEQATSKHLGSPAISTTLHHPEVSLCTGATKLLYEHVNILSLGIDYQRYNRFQTLAPIVNQMMDGAYHIQLRKILTSDEYAFCYNFVLESILSLQQLVP